ncbi:MAG: hypothetical protein AB7O97_22670 [Planctomycetota bacterium]
MRRGTASLLLNVLALAARALALLVAAGPANAQAPAWDVPEAGALQYERTVERFTVAPPAAFFEPLIRGGEDGGHEWRMLACEVGAEPSGWEQPGFDDSGWERGRTAFGTDVGKRPGQRTRWDRTVLLLRTTVDLGRKRPRALLVRADHDDTFRLFVHGALAVEEPKFGRDKAYVIAGDALKANKAGPAVIAVRCENTGGAQDLDLSIEALTKAPPGGRGQGDRDATVAELGAAAGRARRALFGEMLAPGLVLHGELGADRQRPEMPPVDLREVPFWIACDLFKHGAGGSYQRDIPRMYRLGDLVARGRFGAADAQGWQVIELEIATAKALDPQGQSKRYLAEHVLPSVVYDFRGALELRRQVQRTEAGARVVAVEAALRGTLFDGDDRRQAVGELEFVERYRFTGARANQDAEFRALVRTAIDRGTKWLRQEMATLPGTEFPAKVTGEGNGRRTYGSGRLALGLQALLRGGLPVTDDVVAAARRELAARTLVDTYALGSALMALEACYAPPNEIADILQGLAQQGARRTVTADDRALLQEWLTLLVDNVDTRVDPEHLVRFNYVRAGRFDQSVNQYGLLGTYAAHLCGLQRTAAWWQAAANHLMAAQCDPGPPVRLALCDYAELLRRSTGDAEAAPNSVLIAPAGWNYEEPRSNGEDRPSWGAMTCAGITGLAICEAALRDLGVDHQKQLEPIAAARASGFAWMAEHLTVRHHPGTIHQQHNHYYYYLYGLERACLLSGIARIQERDWYFEGAMMLALLQRPDGSWPGDIYGENAFERAAMAVLFLAKSTPPVLTGR